jgi:hypothetical protein
MGLMRVASGARFMDAKMHYTRGWGKLKMFELPVIRPEVGEIPHEGDRGVLRHYKR